jgi:hypothetical protein
MRRRRAEKSRASTENQSTIFGYAYPKARVYHREALSCPWEEKSRSLTRGSMRRRRAEKRASPAENESMIVEYAYPEAAGYDQRLLTREHRAE